MESDYHWLVTVGLVASSVIAVTANLFLLLVFARRRGLRTVPNRFVINLLITNLLSSILLIPLLLADQGPPSQPSTTATIHQQQINRTVEQLDTGDLVFQEEIITNSNIEVIESVAPRPEDGGNFDETLLCYFAQAATSFVCTASIFSILLIGVNQYFGVIHSLRYHFYINKCRSTVFIGSSWFAAFVCAILSSLSYNDSSLWHFCKKPRESSDHVRILSTVYAFTYFIVVILAPFAAICVIYVCIYSAAHQNSERMRKSTSASSNAQMDCIQVTVDDSVKRQNKRDSLPKVHSAPNFSELAKNSTDTFVAAQVKRTSSDRNTNNFITNLKHKLSNASVFRYREETRAAKISILVIFTVLICYVPYGLTLVLSSECIQIDPGQFFIYLSLVLLVFSNIISPFLFGYRNKRVKREIGKIFGLIPKSSQKMADIERYKRQTNIVRNRSFEGMNDVTEPFLADGVVVPEVIVTYKPENEKKSILKRVGSGWGGYKKCNFIAVPDGCLGEARGSFSSASTQISSEE